MNRTMGALVMMVAFGGCGDDAKTADVADNGNILEVAFPDGFFGDADGEVTDTRTPADAADTLDTAAPVDTSVADTNVPEDTAAPEDTTVPEDTLVADSALPEDTSVPVDTSPPEDTLVADTAPREDTAPPEDTAAPVDTAEDTAPIKDTSPPEEVLLPGCHPGMCETNVATSGDNCANAYVIGRPNAQTGFGHAGSTIGAANDSDFSQAVCGDSFGDRFYQIYLRVGEQLWVNGNPSPAAYDLTYGLYRGVTIDGTAAQDCGVPITCVDSDLDGTTPDRMPYQAIVEGWHTIVVDGRNMNGDYTIVVTLDTDPDDCCP